MSSSFTKADFDAMSTYEHSDSPPAYRDAVYARQPINPKEQSRSVRSVLKTIVLGNGSSHPALVRARNIERRIELASLNEEARRAEAKQAKKAAAEARVAEPKKSSSAVKEVFLGKRSRALVMERNLEYRMTAENCAGRPERVR